MYYWCTRLALIYKNAVLILQSNNHLGAYLFTAKEQLLMYIVADFSLHSTRDALYRFSYLTLKVSKDLRLLLMFYI